MCPSSEGTAFSLDNEKKKKKLKDSSGIPFRFRLKQCDDINLTGPRSLGKVFDHLHLILWHLMYFTVFSI